MDETIERILNTDEDIRNKINEKQDRLDKLQDEISLAKKDIDRTLLEEYEKSIAQARESAEARLQSETKLIDEKYEKLEASLMDKLTQGQKKLSDSLFNKVIE